MQVKVCFVSAFYKLLVDESGDQGLDRIRGSIDERGASPFMTLGAVLVPNSRVTTLENLLFELREEFGKETIHSVELNHFQVAYFARKFSECGVKLFGVISKKETLQSYRDENAGERQAESYYNKCSQYLLEQVGGFLGKHGIASSHVSIVYERKNHDYQRLHSYIKRIRDTPMDRRAVALSNIDPLSITAQTKSQLPILSFADLTAFALFQSVNESKSNYGVPEERYLRELLRKFHRDPETGIVANYGIKYIKAPRGMGLSGQVKRFVEKQYRKINQ